MRFGLNGRRARLGAYSDPDAVFFGFAGRHFAKGIQEIRNGGIFDQRARAGRASRLEGPLAAPCVRTGLGAKQKHQKEPGSNLPVIDPIVQTRREGMVRSISLRLVNLHGFQARRRNAGQQRIGLRTGDR